jgi:tetratricopeptide (TPR) repeat protein
MNYERAVQAYPNNWMAWIRYGDYLWHEGGLYTDDGRSRAVGALLRATELDTLSNAEPFKHLNEYYTFTRNREAFLSIPEDLQERLPRLVLSMMDPDESVAEVDWEWIEQNDMGPIIAITDLQIAGAGMEDAERLAASLEQRAADGDAFAAWVVGVYALNRGQPERATRLLQIASIGNEQAPEMWLQQNLFADGEEEVAREVRDSLESALARITPEQIVNGDVRLGWTILRQRAWVAIWDMMHGDTTSARPTIEFARATQERAAADESLRRLMGSARYNRTLVEALLAVVTGSPDADRAVTVADSVFRVGGIRPWFQAAYLLVLADLYRQIGDTEAALNRYRREWTVTGAEPMRLLPARRLGQARMAARLGLHDEAIRAYEHYLTLHSDPEPALVAQVAEVQAELDALR